MNWADAGGGYESGGWYGPGLLDWELLVGSREAHLAKARGAPDIALVSGRTRPSVSGA